MSSSLPIVITRFVNDQPTKPIEDLLGEPWRPKAKRPFPFQDYYYTMVAGALLSGRIRPTVNRLPNKTEVRRWCKASNFNPNIFEWVGSFLLRCRIIKVTRYAFTRDQNADALENRDLDACRRAFFAAFLHVIDTNTPSNPQRTAANHQVGFEGYVRAWARAFKGKAVPEESVGSIALAFSQLPKQALWKAAAAESGSHSADDPVAGSQWFDDAGQKAFNCAMAASSGFCYVSDKSGRDWVFVSSDLEVILGLASVKNEAPAKEFVVQSDLTMTVGSHHSLETLACLFRFATVATKGQVLTLKLDTEAIKDASTQPELLKEFRDLLQSFQPELPSTVQSLLSGSGSEACLGKSQIRGCRALIKPDTPELLEAIRRHRSLKNYLMADPPPGYLLIKEKSDPWNFIRRCKENGFEIEISY